METLFYVSLGINLVLIWFLVRQSKRTETAKKAPKQHAAPPEAKPKPRPVVNAQLRTIAEACEAKLPQEDRGKIKLLVKDDAPEKPAILQIGDLKLSLCRMEKPQSLFHISSFMEALTAACFGYNGTGRYIPIPKEVEQILSQRHIINVYLEALGLEKISEKEDYWCVDTETGWNTGWKRFQWDIAIAFERLHRKSRIRQPNGEYLTMVESEEKVNLFLLLKGWEHLFVEA